MASPIRPRLRNSKDEPPGILKKFIRLYERDHRELQQCIERLSRLVNTFEEDFRRATEGSRNVGIVGIAGGVVLIAALALAPFTLGASAVVGGAGAGMALGGGIAGGIFNFKKMTQQKKLSQNIKEGLKEFEEKIIPMNEIMRVICQCKNETQSHLNPIPEPISDFSTCVACLASEFVRMIRIDGIGEAAAQISKTLHLTGTLAGIFGGVGIVLDIVSVIEDNEALEDMDNLAITGQISEIKSKAGKFIVEMRKVIHELQNTMDELKKTKDIIEELMITRDITEELMVTKDPTEKGSERASAFRILCALLIGFFVSLYLFSVFNL